MAVVMVDIEADGPIPGDYSMIAIGAVIVDEELKTTFYTTLRPISDNWLPDALAVSGFTRAETEKFDEPKEAMLAFRVWLAKNSKTRPWFISDNNGFDWQFVNWYFWHFLGENPFGHSSTNLGSLYKGLVGTMRKNFKHLRKTKHTHHPTYDAIGNAEALLYMKKHFGLEINLGK